MAGFWAKYKKKYITEPMLRKNGYYELSEVLKKKLELLEGKDCSGEKYCDYFTWDEFYEFITKTTFLTLFSFDGIEYGLEIGEKQSYFYMEGTQNKKGFSEKYETPNKLLENARIDGKAIKEIWDDLILSE